MPRAKEDRDWGDAAEAQKKDSPKPPEAGEGAQPSEAINSTDTLTLDFGLQNCRQRISVG